MSRLPLKSSVIKKLFAFSGNLCSFPGCLEKIVDEYGTIIGEICHIEAAEEGGERYNDESNDEFRRGFENLMLMCSNHHKKTNNIEIYSTENLIKYKRDHESRFSKEIFSVSDTIVKQAINKHMEQINNNQNSGSQFNNQSNNLNIGNQIGTQNNFYDPSKERLNIDGARRINQKYKKIIDQFKQNASPPSTDVIDFRNELKDRFERPVELIPSIHLRFRM
jgi:hypothetical protein